MPSTLVDHRRHVHIRLTGNNRCTRCGDLPPANACASFVWSKATLGRCATAGCGVERDEHPAPAPRPLTDFDRYLAEPCDHCPSTATHNGISSIDGVPGKFCNEHTDFDHNCRARND